MFRRTTLLAFALILLQAGTPAFAASFETAPKFGKVSCPPLFPCALVDSRDADRSVIDQIINNTNTCIARSLSLRSPDGYFVESYGIGSDMCLKTKPASALPAEDSKMLPHCCIKPSPSDESQCMVVCIKYSTK